MATLYIDTNIIIDAIEGRKNKFGKDVGNPACDLFLDSTLCKHTLLFSTWMLEELDYLGMLTKSAAFFSIVKKKIVTVPYSKNDRVAAQQRSLENPDDALHAILAEKQKADFIVTRNTDHFKQLQTKIPIRKPEDLL